MSQATCPTCHQQFDPQQSRAMPFCSERCRGIDLNRWLKEEISLPTDETPEGYDPRQADDQDEN